MSSSVLKAFGSRIQGFVKAWRTACRRAGCPGRIPHDFRRTAVRNLERAGVPRSVLMAMVGHKTEAIYRRYDIVSERDLTCAARQLDEAAGIGLINPSAFRTVCDGVASRVVLLECRGQSGGHSTDKQSEVNAMRLAGAPLRPLRR
jgi:hypothetical protein